VNKTQQRLLQEWLTFIGPGNFVFRAMISCRSAFSRYPTTIFLYTEKASSDDKNSEILLAESNWRVS
jgi:hypothetical protein